ncbi:MAG: hypothetical protein IJT00_03730 [Lachnospiraceae bacterium]|nr:hypothetical protein [Lachnospiraceae bacterium]
MKKKILQITAVMMILVLLPIYAAASGSLSGNALDDSPARIKAESVIGYVREPEIKTIAGSAGSFQWVAMSIRSLGMEFTEEETAGVKAAISHDISELKNNIRGSATTYVTPSGKVRFSSPAYAAKAVIALSLIGEDPCSYEGYDLCYFIDHSCRSGDDLIPRYAVEGVFVVPYVLWAVNISGYELEPSVEREMIGYLTDNRDKWKGNNPDAAGPVLLSLSPYMTDPAVREAVDLTVAEASASQDQKGGWSAGGVPNSNSTAEMMMGLYSVGIADDDPRFLKDNKTLSEALDPYYAGDRFLWRTDSPAGTGLATTQCLWALCSLIDEDTLISRARASSSAVTGEETGDGPAADMYLIDFSNGGVKEFSTEKVCIGDASIDQ